MYQFDYNPNSYSGQDEFSLRRPFLSDKMGFIRIVLKRKQSAV